MYTDTHRQVLDHLVHALFQRRTEHLDVAAGLHADGQAKGCLAVVTEHWRGWVDIAALDVGDISQAEEAVVDPQVDGLQVFFRGKLPGRAHRDALRAGLDHAGRRHRILRLKCLHYLALVNAQGSQLAGGEVQVQHFVLGADQLDLADVGYIADLGPCLFHVVPQLAQGQAVSGKGIDRTEYITEFVVEARPLDTGGKFATNVLDFLAHLVPDFRDVLGLGGVAKVHVDRGLAGAGVAFGVVE
ncbi:hypothetical protein D3C79_760260 [compost metagenome]